MTSGRTVEGEENLDDQLHYSPLEADQVLERNDDATPSADQRLFDDILKKNDNRLCVVSLRSSIHSILGNERRDSDYGPSGRPNRQESSSDSEAETDEAEDQEERLPADIGIQLSRLSTDDGSSSSPTSPMESDAGFSPAADSAISVDTSPVVSIHPPPLVYNLSDRPEVRRHQSLTRSKSVSQNPIHRRPRRFTASSGNLKQLSVSEKIRLLFDLPTVEPYVAEFQCWLVRHVMLKGCLFLTTNSLCFYAKLPPNDHEKVKQSGWLSKRTSKSNQYFIYWFVLKGDILSFYDNSKELYYPRGTIDLKSVSAIEPSKTKPFKFKIILQSGKTYRLQADTEPRQVEWIQVLNMSRFHACNKSVRIVLPYTHISGLNWVSSSLSADTVMVSVRDPDTESEAGSGRVLTDEYYFSYFPSTEKAFNTIKSQMQRLEVKEGQHEVGQGLRVRDSMSAASSDTNGMGPLHSGSSITVGEGLSSTSSSTSSTQATHPTASSSLGQWRIVEWWRSTPSVRTSVRRMPWARHRKSASDVLPGTAGLITNTHSVLTPSGVSFTMSPFTSTMTLDDLKKRFPLPPSDTCLHYSYNGYLVNGYLPKYGKLYLTDHHLCFQSRLVGVRTQLMVPFVDVERVTVSTSGLFYRLSLLTTDHTELWFEFHTSDIRDLCLQKVLELKEKQKGRSKLNEEKEGKIYVKETLSLEEIPSVPLSPPTPLTLTNPLSQPPLAKWKITCLTIGTRGDVQPFIALCKQLQLHGHQCTIATHDEYKQWIESHHIQFRHVGGNPSELMKLCVDNGMFSLRFLREASLTFRAWIDDLLLTAWEACQGSDVLIASPVSMAGAHIAERLKIPYWTAFPMPWTRTRSFPHPFASTGAAAGEPLSIGTSGVFNAMTWVLMEHVLWRGIQGQVNRWRVQTLKLQPTSSGDWEKRVPCLYAFSPSVVPPPPDWPGWIHLCGYWFLDEPNKGWEPSEKLKKFLNLEVKGKQEESQDKRKIVYIGFGSIIVPDPEEMTRVVVEAVEKAGVKAILSKGWSTRGRSSSSDTPLSLSLPESILEVDHVPHDWLFPHLDAVVHHGGAGTTAAGLRAGIPTLIKPFFGDQYFWAGCIQSLGAGLSLKKLEVDSLCQALIKVVSDDRIRARAKVAGERIQAERGVEYAVQILHRDVPYMQRELQESERLEASVSGDRSEGRITKASIGERVSRGRVAKNSSHVELGTTLDPGMDMGYASEGSVTPVARKVRVDQRSRSIGRLKVKNLKKKTTETVESYVSKLHRSPRSPLKTTDTESGETEQQRRGVFSRVSGFFIKDPL